MKKQKVLMRTTETEASGPVQNGIWDTRTRENCQWCPQCSRWLRLSAFYWLPEHERLVYHQMQYCRKRAERAWRITQRAMKDPSP